MCDIWCDDMCERWCKFISTMNQFLVANFANLGDMRGMLQIRHDLYRTTQICRKSTCRVSGSGRGGPWSGGRTSETRNTYGDYSRGQQWQNLSRDDPSRFNRSNSARREEEEDHEDEDEDRPPTIRDQRLGEVLYGVFPVLNALKAKR